jgi:hypothetical protein
MLLEIPEGTSLGAIMGDLEGKAIARAVGELLSVAAVDDVMDGLVVNEGFGGRVGEPLGNLLGKPTPTLGGTLGKPLGIDRNPGFDGLGSWLGDPLGSSPFDVDVGVDGYTEL